MENPSLFASGPRWPVRIQHRQKQSEFGRNSSLSFLCRGALLKLICFVDEGEQPFDADAQVDGTVRFLRTLQLVDALLEAGDLTARMRHSLLECFEIQDALPSLDGHRQHGARDDDSA